MTPRARLLLLVVLLGLALGALGARLRPRPAPAAPPPAPQTRRDLVALGEGRVLRARSRTGEPIQVQQLTARADLPPDEGWSWSGPQARMEWTRRGRLIAGLAPGEVPGRRRLELFDAATGHAASLPAVGVWCFAGDGVAAVVSVSRDASELALVTSGSQTRWTARLPHGRGLRLEATDGHVVAWSRERAWTLELQAGALLDLGPLEDVAGVVDETLLGLREGKLVALPLGGAAGWTIDLGQEPILDGTHFVPPRPPGTSPRLLGRHAGRWIVSYATETLTDATTNDEGWRTPATQHLAAVTASTGELVWRRTLGPLELPVEPGSGDELPPELLALGWTEDETHERTYWLGSVVLADGAVRWSTTCPAQGYTAEPLLVRRGPATYLLARGVDNRPLLARFAGGRLTGALRGAPARGIAQQAIDADEVWATSGNALVRLGPTLIGLPPDPDLPQEVVSWTADRLRLPRPAR